MKFLAMNMLLLRSICVVRQRTLELKIKKRIEPEVLPAAARRRTVHDERGEPYLSLAGQLPP